MGSGERQFPPRGYPQRIGTTLRFFSNRTFAELIMDATNRDIFDDKYSQGGSSKANRLRTFWSQETNPVVARVLAAILEHGEESAQFQDKAILLENARRAVTRLERVNVVEQAEVITEIGGEGDFDTIARDIRDKIEKNQPEVALDRLHTFVTKYIRSLCPAHCIETPRDKPLHSIFGEYVKKLQAAGALESPMSERILKNSIGVLEAFNHVRNDQSLAHDNPLLNYEEALLIFNNIANALRFIRNLERHLASKPKPAMADADDEIPF